jgi:hypothetical protein
MLHRFSQWFSERKNEFRRRTLLFGCDNLEQLGCEDEQCVGKFVA